MLLNAQGAPTTKRYSDTVAAVLRLMPAMGGAFHSYSSLAFPFYLWDPSPL